MHFASRSIVHLDADAFFASVEQAADPRLRGKAIAVGGDKRGIVASASYEARRFGVYTPMPTVRARRLCPRLIVVPGDFEKYERFSRWMFSYAEDFTPDIEIGSIDEGYFDLTGAGKSPADIADTIRRAIFQSLKITVSEGIGPNKLISQIASKLEKPSGFLQVKQGGELRFLHPLQNHWLPGIGPKTATRLDAAGLAFIGQIARTPIEWLSLLVGSTARTLHQFANGIDDRPIIRESPPAKSYGQQETFGQDTIDEDFVEATLRRMADELMAKVRADGKSIRTLTVKVRYNDMAEDQRSESLWEPTDLESDLYGKLRPMLRQAWQRRVSLRLVSLKLSHIYDGYQRTELPLFPGSQQHETRRQLAAVVDRLREEHGRYVVMHGHDLALRQDVGTLERSNGGTFSRNNISTCKPSNVTTCFPLRVHSHYSFLDSTLSIEAIVRWAVERKLSAIALTDTGNLHGAVEFVETAKANGIKPILGAEFGGKLYFVENEIGYGNLCRLITQASMDVGVPPHPNPLPRWGEGTGSDGSERLSPRGRGRTAVVCGTGEGCHRLTSAIYPSPITHHSTSGLIIESAADWPAVHYALPADRLKYDMVQSIRTLTLLRQDHPDKKFGGAYDFATAMKVDATLARRAHEIAERCNFQFELGKLQFPKFNPTDGSTPADYLRRLVMEGFEDRYGNGSRTGDLRSSDRRGRETVAEHKREDWTRIRDQVETELGIIHDVGYEEYFLVVWNILEECKRRGINWITRGSAADSLVCYCLGISDVCPIRFDLYFRRFLNKERMKLNKLPDIDIDFPHDRKDDVIDLIFDLYPDGNAAVVGGFSTYQGRSALADICKVLGVSEYQARRFTEKIPHVHAVDLEAAVAERIECHDLPLDEPPYSVALKMAKFLDGFPRYPKMHPCGVVLSRGSMLDLTPCFMSNKGYPTTHFDMDSVEAVGLVKIDILAQGGLAVMRDVDQYLVPACSSVEGPEWQNGQSPHSMAYARGHLGTDALEHLNTDDPYDDPDVWELIASGGARAVHHIESPAMISLCRMCNVREIEGLIAIVSVIRPGAANGEKKITFTRRYQGLEPVVYPHPSLEPCLKSTYGMVVYEEHILQISEAFAGLSPGRADVLRRALVKQQWDSVEKIGREFTDSARASGRNETDITNVWKLVCGFSGYAFCKAHSTAYGIEAYQSAWLKKNFPAEFMAAVLTNGKGFYGSIVYVLECHRLGIPLAPPTVNDPGPMFSVVNSSDKPAIRVPAVRTKGVTERTRARMIEERKRGTFVSLEDFYRRVEPGGDELERLMNVGAFDEFGAPRTQQFWEIQRLKVEQASSLFPAGQASSSVPGQQSVGSTLTEPTRQQRLRWESELLDFPASGHPLELHDDIAWETYCPVAALGKHIRETVTCCGLIIEDRVHEQVTGEPMKFLTLADWTGIIETELFAETYKSYGLATVRYPVLEITATVEPYENGRGFSLRVHRAGAPRKRKKD